MSEMPLHTEHFTAKERAMSTPWHNICTHHHPTTGSCSIPPLRVWALGCDYQDSQPGKEEDWQFHHVLGQQVLQDSWQNGFLCWWQ